MSGSLPRFRGYTIDFYLREFRKIGQGKMRDFVPFDSRKGQMLLQEYWQSVARKPRRVLTRGERVYYAMRHIIEDAFKELLSILSPQGRKPRNCRRRG
jgi:hypothetical protein